MKVDDSSRVANSRAIANVRAHGASKAAENAGGKRGTRTLDPGIYEISTQTDEVAASRSLAEGPPVEIGTTEHNRLPQISCTTCD